jgi:Carboxypeptidase regulatory-like domain
MKFSILAAALLIAGPQGIPPLVGPLVSDGAGVVTGVVRHATTGRPIADAQVAAAVGGESIDEAFAHASTTDRDGRFTIKGVAPGEHVAVLARAEGFFSLSNKIPVSPYVTKDVAVNEGQQVDAGTLELIPGAAISGRLAGSDGRPAIAATVQALRASYIRGQLTFTLVKSTHTDDLGDYRLFWLPPGEYYVRGQYRDATADQPERYARVFFPGIAEEDAAPPVAVGPGSEISGIDIAVPATPIRGVTLSGQVSRTEPVAAGVSEWRVTSVDVAPRDRRVLLVGDASDVFQNQAADPSQGRFEIRNVPPGEYNLLPVVSDSAGSVRTASVPVNVAASNVGNISAVLDPEIELRGRVTWEGNVLGSPFMPNSILVTSLDMRPGMREPATVAINPDSKTGEFVVPHLPPGKYALQLAPSFRPPDTFIADVEKGGASVTDSGFTISGESSDTLEVKLNGQGGAVSGTVLDTARLRPFARATIVLIPDKLRQQNYTLFKETTSAADGTFTFLGVPPGNYRLLALDSATPGIWENPLFVQKHETRSLAVDVVAGMRQNVQLTIIP